MSKCIVYLRILIVFLILSSFCLLNSCVSLKPDTSNAISYKVETTTQRQKEASKIKHWHAQGAFSIASTQKTELANYQWTLKKQNQYSIRISSALNLYSLTIDNNGKTISLNRDQQPTLTASSPEKLLQKAVGYSLPISNLYYWIRGLPAPNKQKTALPQSFDDYGHLKQLTQNGWVIRYLQYTHVNNTDLPSLMKLEHGNIKIKLVIKSWTATT